MAETAVAILGPDGKPIERRQSRARALSGGSGRYSGPPYDAADLYGQHMAEWQPYLWSPDGEINSYRDRIVSRARDLAKNDGWAAGAVTRILDNAVGSNLRPIARPDHRFLANFADNPAFDHVWAKEYSSAVDANWRTWAVTDLGRYCDATRNQTFGQMMRVAFRHKLIDGDSLAVMQWIPERVSRGRARYCTAVQLVDPDRLSNPQMRFDSMTNRGGVEIDRFGAAIAYHIRKAHAGDWFSAAESVTWERIARETSWGRPIVVHDYEGDRASQHRGGAGIFTPVLQRLKMLVKYDGVELDASIINAIFAAYVESPFDHDMMAEALEDNEKLPFYQDQRREFHDQKSLTLGNARIPMLYPGEKINSVRRQPANRELQGIRGRGVAQCRRGDRSFGPAGFEQLVGCQLFQCPRCIARSLENALPAPA
jgi:lambda family phage portal protein